jgi:putative phosphoribosyl transferase
MELEEEGWSPAFSDTLPVQVPAGISVLEGELRIPPRVTAVVVMALDSGSGRFSGLNLAFAKLLGEAGFATLVLDLLTGEEESLLRIGDCSRGCAQDFAGRMAEAVHWLGWEEFARGRPIGLLACGSTVASAFLLCSMRGCGVKALVACSGRGVSPLMVRGLQVPTLLVHGSGEGEVDGRRLKEAAGPRPFRIRTIEGVEDVLGGYRIGKAALALAKDWFRKRLPGPGGLHRHLPGNR